MANGFNSTDYKLQKTSVAFKTADTELKSYYDIAEAHLKENETVYNDKRLIKEGATYPNVWLETQPMGGEHYAKRNIEVGFNNILIFLQYQRRDGRFPGMIGREPREENGVVAFFDWMQGYYFLQPALRMYYITGKDESYLRKLYHAAKDFDAYLWSTRDSNGDGCLESWCPWDTGEDNCTRMLNFGAEDGCFGGDVPPKGIGKLPYQSMEYMAYSYANRYNLAIISEMLGLDEKEYWLSEAEKVRERVKEYLWDDERKACFDRDCDGVTINNLSHTNLRCMYHRLFDREMAEAFMEKHLFNPDEFYTPTPFPANAINDPFFKNDKNNNWSGPCQGLIYQRSIDALHNYGHYTEALDIGRSVIRLIKGSKGQFYQQWDPITGEHGNGLDGYGPMIFAFTEYISYLCGVNFAYDEVFFSSVSDIADSSYTQNIIGKSYRLDRENGNMTAYLDGAEIFKASAGLRVVTDVDGRVIKVICIEKGIDTASVTIDGKTYTGSVQPNGVYALNNGKLELIAAEKCYV